MPETHKVSPEMSQELGPEPITIAKDNIKDIEKGNSNSGDEALAASRHVKELGKEMWLTRQFVMRPCVVCLLGLVLIAICVILTFSQELMTVPDATDRDFLVWDDVKTYNWD